MGIAQKLLDTLESRRATDGHNVVGIQGPPGTGKSTVALGLALNLNDEFTVDDVHYSREDWKTIINAPKGGVFILDEGANVAMNRTWQQKDQVKLMQILNMIRQRNHTLIWCTPNLARLDIIVREDLLTHKVNCIRKGVAKVRVPGWDRDGEPAGWRTWPGVLTWNSLEHHEIWPEYSRLKEQNYLKAAAQTLNDPQHMAVSDPVTGAVVSPVSDPVFGVAADPAKRNTYRDPLTHKFAKRPTVDATV